MAADYGTRIKLRRQALGMNQQQFAERLGVHVSTIGTWERAEHFPVRYQGAIEAMLGISLDGDADGQPAFDPDNPDEARIMSWTDLPYEKRLEWIEGLRAARRAGRKTA